MINNINFKAKFISNTTIQAKNTTSNDYTNMSASFIELEHTSQNDVNAVEYLTKHWTDTHFFLQNIYKQLINIKQQKQNYNKFYALTLQKNNFANIDAEQILGITQITILPETKDKDKNFAYLDYLQVKPEFQNNNSQSKYPEFKHIGKAILKNISDIYDKRDIIISALPRSIKFYKKIGCKKVSELWAVLKAGTKIQL